MNIPDKFQYRHEDDHFEILYTASRRPDGTYEVSFDTGKGSVTDSELRQYLEAGLAQGWVVIEDCGMTDEEYCWQASPSLEELLQLTRETNTNVFLSNGTYEFYSSVNDNCQPFVAHTGAEAVEIMAAIRVLAKAVLEGAAEHGC